MNRRTAILATVMGWLGLGVRAQAATVETRYAAGALLEPVRGNGMVDGVKFARDVIAYELFSETKLMPDGRACCRVYGWVSAGRYYCTSAEALDGEPLVILPLRSGFKRHWNFVFEDALERMVRFDVMDHEIVTV